MLKNFTTQDQELTVTHIPWLFLYIRGPHGAHARILSPRRGRGPLVYVRNDSDYYGYSNTRAWIVPGIVAIRHNDDKAGTLKSVKGPGWSWRWVNLRISRVYAGFQVQLCGPNHYTS